MSFIGVTTIFILFSFTKPFHVTGVGSKGTFGSLGNFTSPLDGRAWTYFISNYDLSANDALLECSKVFGGRLLQIFTKEEDEYIRIRLQANGIGPANEYVISGGRYNSITLNWEWVTTGSPFAYANWLFGNPPVGNNLCMHVVGELSSYGWVGLQCNNPHKFICQY